MDPDEQMRDINFCLRKEAEYSAKARAIPNSKIKSAYEAVAREYAYRAKMLKEQKTA